MLLEVHVPSPTMGTDFHSARFTKTRMMIIVQINVMRLIPVLSASFAQKVSDLDELLDFSTHVFASGSWGIRE